MSGLDFWIGEWEVTWEGGAGRNVVTRELDGHVVLERFEASGPEPFSGLSVSVLEAATGQWRQTWVDSTGSYWTFVGGAQPDGTFVFATTERVDSDRVFKRMVFSRIEKDAFDWRWEFSEDAEQWDRRWFIRYARLSS
ncbi:MAG: hypothetical protein WAN48_08955 [Actinomycetes bacterium]